MLESGHNNAIHTPHRACLTRQVYELGSCRRSGWIYGADDPKTKPVIRGTTSSCVSLCFATCNKITCMHMKTLFSWMIIAVLVSVPAAPQQKGSLDIYFIDVEGGQSTLIVTPRGQSLLVDTGWPGFNGRDADRIVAVAKQAGLKRIDYVLITHFHRDHVGGVPQLADRIKIGAFVDHGPNQEDTPDIRSYFAPYQQISSRAKHLVLKPGDTLPLPGVKVQALTAARQHIASDLSGAGQPNDLCSTEPTAPEDLTENSSSLGILLTYGSFSFLDLGDLTKRKEIELVCPVNRVGTVDLYLMNHHGLDQSNSRAFVGAIHPRVAIMDNGARKGGKPAAWQTVHDSPGLEDLWQLHYAMEAGGDHNVAEDRIANPQEQCEGKYLKVSAHADGSFTVFNSRNGFSKTYGYK
jgi:competence protein ComEC